MEPSHQTGSGKEFPTPKHRSHHIKVTLIMQCSVAILWSWEEESTWYCICSHWTRLEPEFRTRAVRGDKPAHTRRCTVCIQIKGSDLTNRCWASSLLCRREKKNFWQRFRSKFGERSSLMNHLLIFTSGIRLCCGQNDLNPSESVSTWLRSLVLLLHLMKGRSCHQRTVPCHGVSTNSCWDVPQTRSQKRN